MPVERCGMWWQRSIHRAASPASSATITMLLIGGTCTVPRTAPRRGSHRWRRPVNGGHEDASDAPSWTCLGRCKACLGQRFPKPCLGRRGFDRNSAALQIGFDLRCGIDLVDCGCHPSGAATAVHVRNIECQHGELLCLGRHARQGEDGDSHHGKVKGRPEESLTMSEKELG